jgi:hypothetical protein
MDKIFVNIIILHMLNYFQLLYDYILLIKKFHPTLFRVIYGYFQKNWLFLVIFGYFLLFHPKLFLVILSNF